MSGAGSIKQGVVKTLGPLGLLALVLIGSASSQTYSDQRVAAVGRERVGPAKDAASSRRIADRIRTGAHPTANTPPLPSAAAELNASLQKIGKEFDGSVGIAVRDIQTGWTSDFDGTNLYPQQSVSKFWVALTALDLVDRGELDLSQRVTVGPRDLTLFHQPIRKLALRPGGYATTLGDLLFRAITQSDNTANDVLLRNVGGPEAVRAFLARKGITGVRFGPGERLLQSSIAGLEWKPEYSRGKRFFAARDDLPTEIRRASFEAYVAEPMDGATPIAIVDALARLQKGEILSEPAAERLLSIMGQTRTGRLRLKAALPEGWTLVHKTGTGQIFEGEQAGYNDIGIMSSPAGRSYAISILIGRTSEPLRARAELIHESVRAIAKYEHDLMRQHQPPVEDGPDRADGNNDENKIESAV
jgi:beta-lactamase class A